MGSTNLKDLIKPGSMKVDMDKIYIMDGSKTLVYSIKDYSLLTSFGKEGEGPGEISNSPFWSNQVSLYGKDLFIEGLMKYLIVDKKGKLIDEKKKTKRFLKMLPLGKNFIVRTFPFRDKDKKFYSVIKIVGPEMQEIKVLEKILNVSMNRSGNIFPVIPDSLSFSVFKNKVYLEDSRKGFLIKVFDDNGKELYKIKKNIKRIKVTKKIIEQEMMSLKESFKQKRLSVTVPIHIGSQGWKAFKKWAKFIEPEYLPSIKDITVKNNRIYLQTYLKKGEKEEYFIMDLKGKIIKRVFLPQLKSFALYDSIMLGSGLKFYDFSDNSFYYLEEDEEDEIWKIIKLDFNLNSM